MDFNKYLPIIYSFHSYLLANPFVWSLYSVILVLIFIFSTFIYMEKNGFNKENSMDTSILNAFSFILPIFYFYFFTFDFSLFNFFTSGQFLFSIFSVITLLYFKSKFSRWSFYKILDVYAISVCILLSLIFLGLGVYYLNIAFVITSILYFIFFRGFQKYILGTSINYFLIFKIKKNENFSFIGGVGLLFVIYTLLIGMVIYVYNSKVLTWNLILLSVLFILFNYFFIRRSRKNQTLWKLHKLSLPSKKKNLNKKENSLF